MAALGTAVGVTIYNQHQANLAALPNYTVSEKVVADMAGYFGRDDRSCRRDRGRDRSRIIPQNDSETKILEPKILEVQSYGSQMFWKNLLKHLAKFLQERGSS